MEFLAFVAQQFNLAHIFQTRAEYKFAIHVLEALGKKRIIGVNLDFKPCLTSTRYVEFGTPAAARSSAAFFCAINLGTRVEATEDTTVLMANVVLSIGHDNLRAVDYHVLTIVLCFAGRIPPNWSRLAPRNGSVRREMRVDGEQKERTHIPQRAWQNLFLPKIDFCNAAEGLAFQTLSDVGFAKLRINGPPLAVGWLHMWHLGSS